jgi:CxxC motif-containing protein (DUF1111 family)
MSNRSRSRSEISWRNIVLCSTCFMLSLVSGCGGDGGLTDGSPSTTPPASGAPALVNNPTPPPGPDTPPATTPPPPAAAPGSVDAGTSYVPLYAADTPVSERIQYTEADGTLVTLVGMRPTERHARERGEPWTAPDAGPGRYLTYPTFYFQNRTFGMEIRDTIPAGGTKITIRQVVNDGVFEGTTFSLFRGTSPDTRDYGWNLNYGFPNAMEANPAICRSTSTACMMSFDANWRTDPHSPLKIGDRIELAPAPFLQHDANFRALIDGGGPRYYSFEQLYIVGVGLRPWYGIAPNLDSAALPDATLLGGQTTLSYNYSDEANRVFQQMANNIGIVNTKHFVEGRRLFHTSFVDGTHSEHPQDNPVFTAHAGQIGPRFNQTRCIACHALNGRSAAAVIGAKIDTMSVLTASRAADGTVVPDANYGMNIQQNGSAANAPDLGVSVKSYITSNRTLGTGEKVELVRPVYAFKGAVPSLFSVRQAPQVIGMGLLEAIPETTILALSDPEDKNGDGVRGIPNWVSDPETGETRLGRFGWKASKSSLRHQAGEALVQDMGVTSPVYPSRGCQKGAADCRTPDGSAGISETEIQRLSQYLALIAVPAQRSLRSGYPDGVAPLPGHDVNPQQIDLGSKLFARAQCVACHTPQLKTGNNHPLAELRNQTISPYTNLLLHDLGPEMADTLPEAKAAPNLWRTAPLWGIGSLRYVQGGVQSARYLHDGRARTITEAILWHGGEGSKSRANFEAFTKDERDALLAFLDSL